MFKSMLRATAVAVATLVLFGGGLLTPAHAANQDKVKNYQEVILYYSPDYKGAWSDFSVNVSKHEGYSFIGGGSGASGFGYHLDENAASAENRHTQKRVAICAGTNGMGACALLPKQSKVNLETKAMRNRNNSHVFTY